MREIKFRIWDKANKKFIYDNPSGTHCYSDFMIKAFTGEVVDVVGFFSGDKDTRNVSESKSHMVGPNLVSGSPYILQQFTGLFDVNGTEIYEGDILQWTSNGGSTSTVKWISTNNGWDIDGWLIEDSYSQCGPSSVIGNIFETPELIQ